MVALQRDGHGLLLSNQHAYAITRGIVGTRGQSTGDDVLSNGKTDSKHLSNAAPDRVSNSNRTISAAHSSTYKCPYSETFGKAFVEATNGITYNYTNSGAYCITNARADSATHLSKADGSAFWSA